MSCHFFYFFFFKQKTAYEMRISDWSSDVCSSDLARDRPANRNRCRANVAADGRRTSGREWRPWHFSFDIGAATYSRPALDDIVKGREIGRASCRERVCQYV